MLKTVLGGGFFFPPLAAPQHMEFQGGDQIRVAAASLHPATATPDLNHVCDLHQSSWQSRILNPLIEAWDRTCNLMVPSRIR